MSQQETEGQRYGVSIGRLSQRSMGYSLRSSRPYPYEVYSFSAPDTLGDDLGCR